MLVSREPHRREVPHEEGAWFEFCKLSWKQLNDARKEGLKDNADRINVFAPEWLKALSSSDEKEVDKLERKQEWTASSFGTEAILNMGIIAWSYEAELNAESIAMLDGATADWAKREIVELNRPPSEDEEKNS